MIPGGPAVNLVTEVADTGVAGGIVAADACCAVGRAIIGDDELEIAKGLSDDGVERGRQESLGIVNGIPMLTRGVFARVTLESAN